MSEQTPKFESERTRLFRAKQLSEREQETIAHIEAFGCSVIQVKKSDTGPAWSYTVGVYDTCGKPEIISVGLSEKLALFVHNEAARRLRQGVDLAEGRHRELIGEVECEFRPVDRKWVEHLIGRALWYYGNAGFPVLQAVYPDLENRFPEDAGFDERFRRPLLQPNAPMGVAEDDLWASADPGSSLLNWKFPDDPHTTAYLSEAVDSGAEPIAYVSHDAEDGAWQFLGDSMAGDGEPVLSCLHHPIDKDASLIELADLPLGWWAERERPDAPWLRYELETEGLPEKTRGGSTAAQNTRSRKS